MGKIALYGGTFDPVTNEHVNIINNLIKEEDIDKVIVMPTFQPPHKESTTTSAYHRVEMLKLALGNLEKVEISTYEIEQSRAVYTYETCTYLNGKFPNDTLYFVMGTDMLETFSTWKNPHIITKLADIILVERTNGGNNQLAINNFEKTFNKKIRQLKYVGKDVSSFEIRTRLKLDLDISCLTTFEVIDYIRQKGLYQKDRYYFYLSQVLPEKRRKHTLNVIICARNLAKRLGVSTYKAELGALLHDNAKYLDYTRYNFTLPEKDMPKSVIHQFLGGYIAENILCVEDKEIIDAIKCHTTGKENMNLLEKIIFTADVIEKGRNFVGVDILRIAVEVDFETGFRQCMVDLYKSLKNSGDVYYLTEQAYNFYKF